MGTAEADGRLRALVEAGIALTSELSLDALLERLVELAAELTGARYARARRDRPRAARGSSGSSPTASTPRRAAIGEPPRGRGILGVLIQRRDAAAPPRPRRGSALGRLPATIPPMRTFLGVPILLRGVAYGNLYLTEKAGGETSPPRTRSSSTLLAAQAAVAIENVRLLRGGDTLVAAARVAERGRQRARDRDRARRAPRPGRAPAARAARRAARHGAAPGRRPTTLASPRSPARAASELLGRTLAARGSKSGRVLGASGEASGSTRCSTTPRSIRRSTPPARRDVRALGAARRPRPRDRRARGARQARRADARFTDDDLRLAETFASRAAVAVDLSERVARDALRRVVAAQELERRRLARELHDETGQALTSILLGLRGSRTLPDPAQAHEALAELRELAVATLQDVRRLAVELHPKALDDFGLVPALERLLETLARADRDRRRPRAARSATSELSGRGRDGALPRSSRRR